MKDHPYFGDRVLPVGIDSGQNVADLIDGAFLAYNGGKLQQQAIPHRLDDAATIIGYQRVNQFRPVFAQGIERAGLIHAHQARITDHIG